MLVAGRKAEQAFPQFSYSQVPEWRATYGFSAWRCLGQAISTHPRNSLPYGAMLEANGFRIIVRDSLYWMQRAFRGTGSIASSVALPIIHWLPRPGLFGDKQGVVNHY